MTTEAAQALKAVAVLIRGAGATEYVVALVEGEPSAEQAQTLQQHLNGTIRFFDDRFWRVTACAEGLRCVRTRILDEYTKASAQHMADLMDQWAIDKSYGDGTQRKTGDTIRVRTPERFK